MAGGIYIAYTGAAAELAQLEIIANNIANASTAGFRRDRTAFDTVLAAAMPYASVAEGSIDLTPATPRLTGDPLHAALNGDGFFVVEGEGGEPLYTRRGDFRLNAGGQLVLPNGRPVLGEGGPLTVPPGQSARLRGDGGIETNDGLIGRLRVVRFADPTALAKFGDSLIRARPEAGEEPVEQARVAVGFVEGANVNLQGEIAILMRTARAFEAAMRSVRTEDELTNSMIEASR
jgi:flagellar basal body rod protein FlgG